VHGLMSWALLVGMKLDVGNAWRKKKKAKKAKEANSCWDKKTQFKKKDTGELKAVWYMDGTHQNFLKGDEQGRGRGSQTIKKQSSKEILSWTKWEKTGPDCTALF